jgi:glycosyltransferase involved in cell wall biosynthesis
MPVRNAAATVEVAVASLLAQTLPDFEALVVDDGSTDSTPAVIASLTARDSRVRLIRSNGKGIVAALNTGLQAARAPLIARMDADDVSHPERFARQVDWLVAQPDFGVVSCRVAFGGDPIARAGYGLHVAWLNELLTDEQIRLNRFIEAPLAHPSVMFRRELVTLHGGYRSGPFPEDFELWLRWLEAGVRMAKVPAELLTWNDPPDRLSRSDPRYDPEAFYRCKAPYLARWLKTHQGAGRRLFIWGAGRPTRRRAELLTPFGVRIEGYVDIDARKIGRQFEGRPVIGPGGVPPLGELFILGYVAKRGARELIRTCLAERGYQEGRDFLLAA